MLFIEIGLNKRMKTVTVRGSTNYHSALRSIFFISFNDTYVKEGKKGMECKFFCPKCAYIVTLAIIMYVGWKLVLFFSDCQCQDIMCSAKRLLIRTGVPPSFWQLKNWFPKDVCQKHISSSAQTEGQICAKLQRSWGITLLKNVKIQELLEQTEERVSFEILSTHSVCLAKFSIFGASFHYHSKMIFLAKMSWQKALIDLRAIEKLLGETWVSCCMTASSRQDNQNMTSSAKTHYGPVIHYRYCI